MGNGNSRKQNQYETVCQWQDPSQGISEKYLEIYMENMGPIPRGRALYSLHAVPSRMVDVVISSQNHTIPNL